jgi:hypothetical protein
MHYLQKTTAVTTLLMVLSSTNVAAASPSFPAVVRESLTLPVEPTCSLCHQGAPSGTTAISAFVVSARARGLRGSDPGSVKTALSKMESDTVDSDGDGVPDITELRKGDDPSATAGQANVDATYGCIASLAPTSPPVNSMMTFGIGAFVAAIVGRRARRARVTG